MEMLIDLQSEPLMKECGDRAAELLAVADEQYRQIREEAEKAVVEWHYSSDDHYPLLDPLGPEVQGLRRGELSSVPVADGYSYGLDETDVVTVKRHHIPERGATAHYHLPNHAGFETIWRFDEYDELDFHKCQGISTSRMKADGIRVVVSKGRYGNERRTAYVVAGRTARVCAVSLTRNRIEPQEEYRAQLDDLGRPLRIVDPRTGFVYYERKRRGNAERMLARLGKELAKQIPKLVDKWAAGREVQGVCLMHGDGLERFPPAVLPILTEAPERARLALEQPWQAWEPSPWLDVVDPIYFDQGVSAVFDKVSPDLVPWLYEGATQQAALECLDELVEMLGKMRWPRTLKRREPFVVYRANYEEGDWRASFRSVLPPAAMEALKARGALPPPIDASHSGNQPRGPES